MEELLEQRKELSKMIRDTDEYRNRTELRKAFTETDAYLAYMQADAALKAHHLSIQKAELNRQIKDLKDN